MIIVRILTLATTALVILSLPAVLALFSREDHPSLLSILFITLSALIIVGTTLTFTKHTNWGKALFCVSTIILSFGMIIESVAYEFPVWYGIPFRWLIPSPETETMTGFSIGLHFLIPSLIVAIKETSTAINTSHEITGTGGATD